MGKLFLGSREVSPMKIFSNTTSLNITPTTSAQEITVSGGYDGYSPVNVAAVTSAIDSNIVAGNIKKGVSILGVEGSLEVTSGEGITREVNSQGKLQYPTSSFTFSLPSNAINIVDYGMYYAFQDCTSLTSVDLSSLTAISAYMGMGYTFYGCTSLTSVDLSSLTTVNGSTAMFNAFYGCTSLTSVDLSSLTTVNGSMAMYCTFVDCTSLTSVDLSSLTTVNGRMAMYYTFDDCTSLTSVDFSSLTTVNGNLAMQQIFQGCTSLTSLSFPSLTSTSFGSDTSQFNNMLRGVTGCTVHFPSNLQSVIGSWSDVTAGFGGTNTTVLFDLPATT